MWPEANAVFNITIRKMIDFVWINIICQFEMPRTFISDNRKQFNCKIFKDFIQNIGIEHKFFSIAHLQINGQIKVKKMF